MALAPAAMQIHDEGLHDSELDSVAKSLLVDSNPDAEGQPDPQDSQRAKLPEIDDLDPAPAEEDEDSIEDGLDPDDDPQDSGEEDEEPEEDLLDDDDGEDDLENEPDEGEEEQELHQVKVDGKVLEVTLDDLKRNYSGEKVIEARLQQATEAKQAVEKSVIDANKRAETADQALQIAQAMIMEDAAPDPDIDWDALYEIDPTEWSHQKALQQAKQEKFQAKMGRIQQAVQANHAEANNALVAERNQIAAREAIYLRDAYPVFADDKTGAERYGKLAEFALERYGKYGLTPEVLQGVSMAVPLIMLNEMYDLLGDEKPKKKKRRGRVKRTVRPGNGTRTTPATRDKKRIERLEKRAMETGHPDDVAKLLIQQN